MYRFSQKINHFTFFKGMNLSLKSLNLGREIQRKKVVFSVLFMGLFISGCSGFKQTVGIEKVAPKDLSVHPYEKALEVPPCIKEMPGEQDQASCKKTSSSSSGSSAQAQVSQGVAS
jgi:hypothetical protein